MSSWIDLLLTGDTDAVQCDALSAWWPRHQALCRDQPETFDQAILGGFSADRLAWAFVTACQAALRALVPALGHDEMAAFCVTEENGNAPRAIRSEFCAAGDAMILNGSKRWATLGPDSTTFLVVGRDAGQQGAMPSLRVARVPATSTGLHVEAMPAPAFVPEVPHGRLRFADVRIPREALLPGDGYSRYVKPFRTLEDIHVQAAVLAYLTRESRRLHWPRAWTERAVASLVALEAIASRDPSSSATHVLLAGALTWVEDLAREADDAWCRTDEGPACTRWFRDRALLGLAAAARTQRTTSAWERLTARP
ncbi:MAG: acyl-CoA dehydrogenase family protein [Panacagrimonas sp.]